MYYQVNNKVESRCCNNTKDCKWKQTTLNRYIGEPYPRVLLMNVSWHVADSNQLPYMDILQFYLAISQQFNIGTQY